MKKTPNLNLPIYDTPETDIFDIQNWNEANNKLDTAYQEVISLKTEIPKLNQTAEDIRNYNENIRVSNENTRVSNENTRVSNESTRVSSESDRVNKENIRISSENTRTSNEGVRVSAENTRTSNEGVRVSAENTRISNEGARVSAENLRLSQEETRKSNELLRVSNETTRQSKEQERLTAEATRITNETARQTAYKEITDARKDFNGVLRDSLNDRLNYDIGYINDRYNKATLVENEAKYISASKSFDGVTKDLKIKGRTLQNLISIEKAKFLDITSGGVIIENGTIQAFGNGAYNNFFLKKGDLFKPSTQYTVIVNIFNNTLDGKCYITSDDALSSSIFANEFTISPGTIGIVKKIVTTKSDISTKTMSFRSFISNLSTTGNIKLQYMVLEGDYTNENIPYFEGIKSVGEEGKFDVISCGKNVLYKEIELGTINADTGTPFEYPSRARSVKFNKVKPSTNYTISLPEDFQINRIFYYDNKQNYIGNFSTSYSNVSFTTPSNCSLIKLAIKNTLNSTLTNEELIKISLTTKLEEGTITTIPYEQYKETRIPITLTAPLSSLPNGVKDEIDIENSKIIRRIGKVVLNGSEDWKEYSTLAKTIGFYFGLLDAKGGLSYQKSISDNFLSIGSVIEDSEGFSHGDYSNNFYIRINSSRLTTQNLEGFKKWLQANPTTVYYELATPIEEPIVLPNNLRTYDGTTNIFTEGSLIEPNVYAKVPSDVIALTDIRNSTVKSKIFANADARVEELEQDVKNIVTQSAWITPTLLNGWTGKLQYRKTSIGNLEILGDLIVGTGTGNTIIASLPSGYFNNQTQTPIRAIIKTLGSFSDLIISNTGDITVKTSLTTGHGISFNTVCSIA